jgi:hypothetical protein
LGLRTTLTGSPLVYSHFILPISPTDNLKKFLAFVPNQYNIIIGKTKGPQMKVYIGYDVSYDGGMGISRHVEKLFDCEVKAFLWEEEKQATEYEWREFAEMDVE